MMKADTYGMSLKKAVLHPGNPYRIMRVMKKAMSGQPVRLGFLGGSITQGCLSSSPETCYAYLVYQWWRKTFPESQTGYHNAGIGGTTSQFGAARADSDLLSAKVDLVVVEFSVNDDDDAHFLETYEGLIRKIYSHETKPAVLIVNSVRYDTGANAQAQHIRVGQTYDIPCVSMKPVIYAKVLDGTLTSREITEDDLHPNDLGHQLMAEVITDFLAGVYREMQNTDRADRTADIAIESIDPITENGYESSVRYQNRNCQEILAENSGFTADCRPQETLCDVFKNGWTAAQKGARIRFCIKGTCIGIQYRKTVDRPAPVAKAVIDGRDDQAVVLDGNFEETWGDCLYLETVAEHLPDAAHTLEIELTETHENDQVPFYLVSVIVSG